MKQVILSMMKLKKKKLSPTPEDQPKPVNDKPKEIARFRKAAKHYRYPWEDVMI